MIENEKTELKKSKSELKEALKSIVAILNKHQSGELYFGIKPDGSPIKKQFQKNLCETFHKQLVIK